MVIHTMALLVHITAGGVGIVSGYVAVYAAKGEGLHRRSGMVFVCAMVAMAGFGATLAAFKGEIGNMIGGLLTAYLVITALTTVRPATAGSRRLDLGAMLVALAVGVANVALWLQARAADGDARAVPPAGLYLVFAGIALSCGLSDARIMRAGGIRGPRRLARHLWRMCFALFVAAGSFFLGQADEIPPALRVYPALLTLSFLPLGVMLYWLWRVRIRPAFRGMLRTGVPLRAG